MTHPPSAIQLRRATVSDSDTIAELAGQLGYPSQPGEIRSRLTMLNGNPTEEVVVAEEVGSAKIVGWMHVSVRSALESGTWAEIVGLVVHEAHRRRRIGESLVSYARDWARARGQDCLRVRTNETRHDAHAFYERAGFTHRKTSRSYAISTLPTPISPSPTVAATT